MNIAKYELLREIVESIKKTKPTNISILDYSASFEVRFEWKEEKIEVKK